MSSPLEHLLAERPDQVVSAPAPAHARLMKAVLERHSFSDPEWIFERKLDGIRCLAVRTGADTRMLSRNDLDLGGRYPEIRQALAAQDHDRFAVDGEIVAFEGSQTSFARLAQRGRRPVAVFFYVFDLLWVDGYDIRALDLRSRKRLLRTALAFQDSLRLTSHRNRDGEAMFTEACRRGWEGVIAKRADSPYRESRSRDWLKFKCEAGQELVIGERGVNWAAPELVAQVGFTEWTRAGRLRHPRFQGLRDDKPATEVVREQ